MQIIFGDSVNLVRDRFTVLELDTFRVGDNPSPVIAWCVVEKIPLEEVGMTEHLSNLHHDMMAQYRDQNWDFCLQAIDHLRGKWNQELDSFYQDLETRILNLKQNPPTADWTPVRLKVA